MIKTVAGIDMGGTNTVIALIDGNGSIICKDSIKTAEYEDPSSFAEAVSKKILTLASYNDLKVCGAGIGAPNGNFYGGTIEYAPNLRWKGVIPLALLLEQHSGIHTLLTNDANAAALGEMQYGGAKGMKDFITITLGTGVGAGIISNGNLVYGYHGFGGEAGHMILFPKGRICGCGRKGCFETYCNATGIVKTYSEISGNEDIRNLTPQIIAEMAGRGDHNAIETYNKTGYILGLAMANCICITNPEAIFLFGGIMNAGDILMKPALKSLEENVLPLFKGKTKILRSSLPEADAAVLGAASLVRNFI